MAETVNSVNVVIGGEAGQGLATIGTVLAKGLIRSGYEIVVTQSYMSRIRGGHNTFNIRASAEPIGSPVEPIDLLVALDRETTVIHRQEMAPKGLVMLDESFEAPEETWMHVPLGQLSEVRYHNVVALGVASCLLGLDQEMILGALEKFLGKKADDVAAKNREALAKAYEWARPKAETFPRLAPPRGDAGRLMMNGNEAVALGAMSAGVKFCAFYPMTPSTSIPLTLVQHAAKLGILVEQAEDEIAALNMALGAGFCGAPAMVATSGGGFALMAEAVSLAAMTETPVVVVVGMRPGPATGLPTRTEQADLDFVLHAGHGEFPRAIYAPGTVEECFHLVRKAFAEAEASQGPVFLLTDQFLADSYRAIAPFPLAELPPVKAGDPALETDDDRPYERYALTDSGLSPRAIPGFSRRLVVADSDEHTPDGHITEDLGVRVQMVDKRLRKMEILRQAAAPPVFNGEEKPDLLLVCFGSALGAVEEAARRLNEQGRRTATCHFPQVWPLKVTDFLDRFKMAREVAVVEGNATGQFARLIRRESGFLAHGRVLRYDGLPITPGYILRQLGA